MTEQQEKRIRLRKKRKMKKILSLAKMIASLVAIIFAVTFLINFISSKIERRTKDEIRLPVETTISGEPVTQGDTMEEGTSSGAVAIPDGCTYPEADR